jgi:hypothetical protein
MTNEGNIPDVDANDAFRAVAILSCSATLR